jgi:hypothetical protein
MSSLFGFAIAATIHVISCPNTGMLPRQRTQPFHVRTETAPFLTCRRIYYLCVTHSTPGSSAPQAGVISGYTLGGAATVVSIASYNNSPVSKLLPLIHRKQRVRPCVPAPFQTTKTGGTKHSHGNPPAFSFEARVRLAFVRASPYMNQARSFKDERVKLEF